MLYFRKANFKKLREIEFSHLREYNLSLGSSETLRNDFLIIQPKMILMKNRPHSNHFEELRYIQGRKGATYSRITVKERCRPPPKSNTLSYNPQVAGALHKAGLCTALSLYCRWGLKLRQEVSFSGLSSSLLFTLLPHLSSVWNVPRTFSPRLKERKPEKQEPSLLPCNSEETELRVCVCFYQEGCPTGKDLTITLVPASPSASCATADTRLAFVL